MILPFELSHLDAAIVQLLFESLTEQEIVPELGLHDLASVRHHLIALIESGYVQGEIYTGAHAGRTARPRCLTIKGYTLLSRMNAERGVSYRAGPRLFQRGAWRMGTMKDKRLILKTRPTIPFGTHAWVLSTAAARSPAWSGRRFLKQEI
jgi:hypothetical protein